MKTIVNIVVLTIILISCNSSDRFQANHLELASSNSVIEQSGLKNEFQVLCENLPKIRLPFEMYCENCCLHPELSELQSQVSNYLPEGASFMGIIEINKDYVSMLATYAADWSIPSVIVFDNHGELIDEEIFLGGYCGSDYGILSKQYFFVNSSTELLEIDSVYHLAYDEETFSIKDTTKVEIEIKSFNVDQGGIKKAQ